jgi:hypothetical protein
MSYRYVVPGYWVEGYDYTGIHGDDRDLTAAQQAAFESAYFSAAYFVEFHFTTGTSRFTSWNTNLDWGGYTWTGTGAMGTVTEVKESEKLQSMSIDFTLTIADPAILALSLSPAESYRNKPMMLYTAPMLDGAILGTPILTRTGTMDQMTVSLDKNGGSVSLRCLPAADKMLNPSNIRVNDPTQKAKYPNSRGFEYQSGLIADPHLWLSKDFQAQRY